MRRSAHLAADAFPEDLHPVLARAYAARNVSSAAEVDYSLAGLQPYAALGGIDAAVELLASALQAQRRILVVGDFDADGATSCAVAVRGLRLMGARHVDYLVPNRFEFGYGLTPEIVEVAATRSPDVIVTVDNGTSSIEGTAAARRCGFQVLITDHHLPGACLPEADAIVNPNLPGDRFPSKALAGVGVIFYVLSALRARLRAGGWFGSANPEPSLAPLLDLVALGTIADVVPLDYNNRIFVAQGLARIRAGRGHPGVEALLRVAGRDPSRTVAADLGFAAAPRLNAAGRLTDMSLGIECLLRDDHASAMEAARVLDQLNRERRAIEGQMQQEALARLDTLRLEGTAGLPVGLCLFDEAWHPGVIGIVAARVRERLHRPVIVFAPQEASALRGSARSVPGLHIRDTLEAVAASHPGLIERFGGHAAAAGLSLPREHLDVFRGAFDREVRSRLGEDELCGTVHSDGPLAAHEIGLELAEVLRAGGPWGQGFPEPLFDGEFDVRRCRVVGERHLKFELAVGGAPGGGGARVVEGIAFNAADAPGIAEAARVFAVYRLDVNVFRDTRRAQLVIEHLEPRSERSA